MMSSASCQLSFFFIGKGPRAQHMLKENPLALIFSSDLSWATHGIKPGSIPGSGKLVKKSVNTVGITKICYMQAPVGMCFLCCPHDDSTDIQYKLFTQFNPDNFQVIPTGDLNALRNTDFDPARPTVIYMMGFSEATDGASTTTLKNTYLRQGDYNFISVDWSRLMTFPWYITAVRNAVYMGDRLANFIRFLGTAGVDISSIHIIGFSLGAEAAGFAGKYLKASGVMVGRITGLDPAYPGYRLTNSSGHLSKGDALFVDVVHTNPGVYGFPTAIGDVDFYPNAGTFIQPGCYVHQLINNKQLQFIYGCSHNRAWRLFAESIENPQAFPTTLCNSWMGPNRQCRFKTDGYLGFAAKPPMTGRMYLETNERPPFGRYGP